MPIGGRKHESSRIDLERAENIAGILRTIPNLDAKVWPTLTVEMREAALREAASAISVSESRPDSELVFENFGSRSLMGDYDGRTRRLRISARSVKEAYPATAVHTLVHEERHAFQVWQCNLPPELRENPAIAEKWRRNFAHYRQAPGGKATTTTYLGTYVAAAVVSHLIPVTIAAVVIGTAAITVLPMAISAGLFYRYRLQPVEHDAATQSDHVIEKVYGSKSQRRRAAVQALELQKNSGGSAGRHWIFNPNAGNPWRRAAHDSLSVTM